MNFFDRFVESFSARELKSRVRAVVLLGFALLAITAAGGYAFLSRTFEIAVIGRAEWAGDRAIEVSVDVSDIERIPPERMISVELTPMGREPFRTPAKIAEIDPSGRLLLEVPGVPEMLKPSGRFDIRLVVVEGPYWRMLWERSR